MVFDLIIVGLGPAGVSAAIYAKRAGLKVLGIEKSMVGGYLNYIDRIDNYAGLYGVSGPDFAFNLFDTLNKLDVEVVNKEVISVEVDGELKKVKTNDNIYLTKNVLIATGREPKKLGIENEEKLRGHGISNCALCDGAFYKDKDVAVVGGGESALQEALYLANICRKVYIIHRRDKFSVTGYNEKKVFEKDNIEILFNSNVVKLIEESDILKGLFLDTGKEVYIDGLFVYIGFVPKTNFLSELQITDDFGYILVDSNYETNIKGIYAIGDTIKKEVYQISVGVGEGALASNKIIASVLSK